jgi:endo-1,4-beta-mannosidase
MNSSRPRFGVNYVPRSHWWHIWVDWDANEIQEDFHAIAALGLDHVRVFCMWHVFQPNPKVVSSVALKRLWQMLDLADLAGLDVEVTVLNGWLSGFLFMPTWLGQMWPIQPTNIFTDPDVRTSIDFYFTQVIKTVADHPRFMGIDLGNEICAIQNLHSKASTPAQDEWQTHLLELCEDLAPNKLHVNGVDHQHWLGNQGFSRQALATTGSATIMHLYPYFTQATERYGSLGLGVVHLNEFGTQWAKAYHQDDHRPIWFQEFGGSKHWMPEADLPDYLEKTVRTTLTCANIWGFTWWCSHDLNPALQGFVPGEYDLGLLDQQGNPKPTGVRMAALIQDLQKTPAVVIPREVALVVPDTIYDHETTGLSWGVAEPFMNLIAKGERPAIVLASRQNDTVYLERRGIKRLIQIGES